MKFTDISNIYGVYEDIKLERGFIHNLAIRRSRRYNADSSLLSKEAVEIDINNLSDVPDGKIRINIEEARFECFFHAGKQKKLYIILDGARTVGGKLKPIPLYNRWSWYPYADFYWLSIEDPMYFKYSELTLGWFYGDEKHNYREYAAYIAEKFSEKFGIDKDNVVFYGSSGGGTAAIHSAALFGGGTAVSINGQINFEYEHLDIAKFKEIVGIDLHLPDLWHRNDLCYVMQEYKNTKYILVENCRSKWDYNDHLLYFSNRMKVVPSYGISQFANIYMWVYEANGKKPHVSFEDKNLFFAVNFLTELAVNNENIDRYKPLYQLFGEFWYDKYEMELTLNKQSESNNALGITMIDSNLVNFNKFDNVNEIDGIELEASEDRYHCYQLKDLKKNNLYYIKLDGVKISPDIKTYTIGVYDKKSKKFLNQKDVNITEEVIYSFMVNETDFDLTFCVFAGKYKETTGNSLYIDKITVYNTCTFT